MGGCEEASWARPLVRPRNQFEILQLSRFWSPSWAEAAQYVILWPHSQTKYSDPLPPADCALSVNGWSVCVLPQFGQVIWLPMFVSFRRFWNKSVNFTQVSASYRRLRQSRSVAGRTYQMAASPRPSHAQPASDLLDLRDLAGPAEHSTRRTSHTLRKWYP